METVETRLAAAQASGNLDEIRAALKDAEKAGADPAQIKQALDEVNQLASSRGEAPPPRPDGPPAASAPADPAALAAARSNAEALKKKGNDCLKANTKSAMKEAIECYTAGLEEKCDDAVLNAQLFGNRAHAHILLRQFVEAVDDCRKALKLDPKNMKAYWRAAKASLHLDLCKNGIEFCEAGLRQQPDDADLMKMKSACAEKLTQQQQRRAEAARTVNQEFNADEAMALQERVNDFSEQVDTLRMKLNGKRRMHAIHQSTRSNLADVPATSGHYVSVGRCFLKRDREAVDEKLNAETEALEEEIPRLTKAVQEMEKRKDNAERELREMIQAFQSSADKGGGGASSSGSR